MLFQKELFNSGTARSVRWWLRRLPILNSGANGPRMRFDGSAFRVEAFAERELYEHKRHK